MLKKVACTVLAMHLPMSVFPVPGGPNRRIPFGGPLSPVKRSLEGKGTKRGREREWKSTGIKFHCCSSGTSRVACFEGQTVGWVGLTVFAGAR